MKCRLVFLLWLVGLNLSGQPYTSYFTGITSDAEVDALGGICLMGGATENDEAMKWFLQRAIGGDILVLRASGSNIQRLPLFRSGCTRQLRGDDRFQ